MVAVFKETQQMNSSSTTDIIVIGAGPVGVYFVNELIKRSPASTIKIFGAEPWQPYNRVRLTDFLSGKTNQKSLFQSVEIPISTNIHTYWNNPIEFIDTSKSLVKDSNGQLHHYSQLILALGSNPHIASISGVVLDNVFTFRDLDEAQALMGRQVGSRRTVVIGGGLLGIEAAKAMQRFNTEVICIEHSTRLMFNQLDDHASDYLEEHLMSLDIDVRTNESVIEIQGDRKVEAVKLSSGEIIECDTVILSTGIKPNIDLARQAGISVGSGIRIDDALQTSSPNVCAIGECAQHEEKIYGLVTPGYEQAAVLAERLSGGKASYKGTTTATRLKVLDYPVFSIGETGDNVSDRDEYIYRDTKNKIYRKLVIVNNRLRGAVAMGEWPAHHRIQEAIEKSRFVWPWQPNRFVVTGELWPEEQGSSVAEWPADTTVCNCMGITRGTLSQAIKDGCDKVENLCAATGASSVCGSCRPLLQELTQSNEPRPAVAGSFLLWLTALCSLVAAMAFYFLPAMPYENSVQSAWQLDSLWRDSLYKQISGFTLLGLSVLITLLSFRKRIKTFNWGNYPWWRVGHVVLGALTFLVIFLHTGFRLGSELNFLLMLSFSGLLLIGALASGVIAQEHRIPQRLATRLRRTSIWMHILLFWPLPALLAFHIMKTYYF